MGRKSAYVGESAKDRSINIMDKFIRKSDNKNQFEKNLPTRRKDPNVPINLWPEKDQLDYYANRTDAQKFDESYSNYSNWITAVKTTSGVYARTFDEFITMKNLKPYLLELFQSKILPKQAVLELRKHGVY